MSFVSTYNSVSVRGWQQSSSGTGGDIYVYTSNAIPNRSDFGYTDCSYNASYFASLGDPSVGDIIIGTKNINNSLTIQYTSGTSGTDIAMCGAGNVVVTADRFYDANANANGTRVGRVTIYSRNSGPWIQFGNIIGNLSFGRLGSPLAIDESGNVILACIRDSTTGNYDIRNYTYNTNTNTYVFISSISFGNLISATGPKMACASDPNIFVITSGAGNTVNIYDNNVWSNFSLNYVANCNINSNGNIVIASAWNASSNIGNICIYTKTSNTWSLAYDISTPTINTPTSLIEIGETIKITNDGNRFITTGFDNNANNFSRNMLVYNKVNNNYTLTQVIANSGFTNFGAWPAISQDGNYLYTTGSNNYASTRVFLYTAS